ncbi:unnamed protein product, partial [Phaeothamnion confervicola]
PPLLPLALRVARTPAAVLVAASAAQGLAQVPPLLPAPPSALSRLCMPTGERASPRLLTRRSQRGMVCWRQHKRPPPHLRCCRGLAGRRHVAASGQAAGGYCADITCGGGGIG